MLDQPVPNPLASNPNVHTHKVFAAVGLILIGTIIAAAGIWWYASGRNTDSATDEVETTTKVSTSSAKTTSTTKDETADWKTFSDSTLNYSLKYPTGWLTNDCGPDPVFFAPKKEYLGVCNSGFGGLIGISTVTGTTFSDLENSYSDTDYDNLKKEKMVLSGKVTTKITGTSKVKSEIMDETGTKKIVYLVNLGTSTLLISYSQSKDWQDYSKEFELMVSTFKFL